MFENLLRGRSTGEVRLHRRTVRLAYVVFTLAAAATLILPAESASAIAILTITAALGGAAWLFISDTGSLIHAERRAWRLLGIGLLLAALGLVVHGLAWLVADDVPTFGPVDLFWILGYVVGIAGIAALPHAAGSRWQRLRLLLDGVIGAVAMSTILWTVTLRDVTERLEAAPLWDRLIGSSYIVLDAVILVVLLTVVIKRSNYRFDKRLVFVGAAIAIQGIGDYTFLTSGLGRTFSEVQPIYACPMLAATLFLATAANVQQVPRRREYADRISAPTWAIIVPYGLAAALFVALLARFPDVGASATDRTLLYATVVIGALVIARQGVTIRESRRLLDDQRADLAASISHELRTPLTTVVGFLDLLDADVFDTPEERREVTSVAADQAAHLSRVVSDLLVLASDAEAQIDLHIEPLTLDQLVTAGIEATNIESERVAVAASHGISVFVDKHRMEHALANLVGNAIRYGGNRVEIAGLADGGDLVLEVHDDGPGVPRKFELLIWEKFERGPNRLNSSVPGSGNGLAITKAIALAHGGSVGYRLSDRLEGSCFWIRLPGRVQIDSAPAQTNAGRLSIAAEQRTA